MGLLSRETIMAAIEALRFREHSQIEEFVLRFGLEDAAGSGGIAPRTAALMAYIVHHSDDKGPNGSALALEVVEYVVDELVSRERRASGLRYRGEDGRLYLAAP